MNKFICIHGHFYQPPRENPWLEEVEIQDSAFPYHDWNQRITAECYAPNSAARMLDDNGLIKDIINNYAYMSFNFGPTLLSWLQRNEPVTYEAILKSDELSIRNFSSHGSAIAQCYNHMIMPLANKDDKRTQIFWGIHDFEMRFGRFPEGMWLPETAVDNESLEIMAEMGIKYTVLAPHQARRIRDFNAEQWEDVHQGTLDTRMPYLCRFASGRSIALFFYDGALSQDIAFGGLLGDGAGFADKLCAQFSDAQTPQLVHIATDGETYGHHHSMGDMALAYCLEHIRNNPDIGLTNYGEFLEKYPPQKEVEIVENSSWSCVHGIERWRNDCGCHSGMHPHWNQRWRKPLREALDKLRDTLKDGFIKEACQYFLDPLKARNEYIDVIINRTDDAVIDFFKNNASKKLSETEKIKALKLLESQRHCLLMYTSCGWFFDELSGIETMQILQYASRAIQLTHHISPQGLEQAFIDLLEKAPSNIPKYGNGAYAYYKIIKPSVLNFSRVGAHYAVSSLFEDYSRTTKIYSFTAENLGYELLTMERHKLLLGRVLIKSDITGEKSVLDYAVFHLGDHNLTAGIKNFEDEKEFARMQQEITGSFKEEDTLKTIRLIEKYFGPTRYSLRHLLKDEQSKILYVILDETLEKIDEALHKVNKYHYPIMQVVKALQVPLPKVLSNTVLVMLNSDLIKVLGAERIDFYKLQRLVEEIDEWALEVDYVAIEYMVRKKVYGLMEKFVENVDDLNLLNECTLLLKTLQPLRLNINLWKAQNIFFLTGKTRYPLKLELANKGNKEAQQWVKFFSELGELLKVRVD